MSMGLTLTTSCFDCRVDSGGNTRLIPHCSSAERMGAEEMELWQNGNTNMPEEVPPESSHPPFVAGPLLVEVVRRLV